MRQTGSVFGVAVFGSLIAARGHFATGLHAALLISVALVLAAVTPAAHRGSPQPAP